MTDQPIKPPTPGEVPPPSSKAAREALNGSNAGSDTRAGSLQGGSATGSERDEAQAASDRYLAELGEGMKEAGKDEPSKS